MLIFHVPTVVKYLQNLPTFQNYSIPLFCNNLTMKKFSLTVNADICNLHRWADGIKC